MKKQRVFENKKNKTIFSNLSATKRKIREAIWIFVGVGYGGNPYYLPWVLKWRLGGVRTGQGTPESPGGGGGQKSPKTKLQKVLETKKI